MSSYSGAFVISCNLVFSSSIINDEINGGV